MTPLAVAAAVLRITLPFVVVAAAPRRRRRDSASLTISGSIVLARSSRNSRRLGAKVPLRRWLVGSPFCSCQARSTMVSCLGRAPCACVRECACVRGFQSRRVYDMSDNSWRMPFKVICTSSTTRESPHATMRSRSRKHFARRDGGIRGARSKAVGFA